MLPYRFSPNEVDPFGREIAHPNEDLLPRSQHQGSSGVHSGYNSHSNNVGPSIVTNRRRVYRSRHWPRTRSLSPSVFRGRSQSPVGTANLGRRLHFRVHSSNHAQVDGNNDIHLTRSRFGNTSIQPLVNGSPIMHPSEEQDFQMINADNRPWGSEWLATDGILFPNGNLPYPNRDPDQYFTNLNAQMNFHFHMVDPHQSNFGLAQDGNNIHADGDTFEAARLLHQMSGSELTYPGEELDLNAGIIPESASAEEGPLAQPSSPVRDEDRATAERSRRMTTSLQRVSGSLESLPLEQRGRSPGPRHRD